jgi:YD repeat-containing protein
VNSTPPKTFATDANGSITGDGQNQWNYDTRGRLASVTTAAGTTTYQVNALGQRVRKTALAPTPTDTIYHYDLAGHLVAESDGTGKIAREYFWLDDTPLAVMQ